MEDLKTIKENTFAEIIEKKSRFIANIFSVESQDEAEAIIDKTRKKYYDAKHNCFAYIVIGQNNDIIKKCSDDGEPAGTAGNPMLEILEKIGLTNVLVVVTRYFGGILLGTGGLVRAYSSATKEALGKANIINKTIGYEVQIVTSYKNLEQLKYIFVKENIKIKDIKYDENVELIVEIPEKDHEDFLEKNKEKIIKSQIKTKKYIEI